MKFNLPNAEALRKLATDAENRKQEFEGGDIRWEKFEKNGHYRFIVCPPYNEHGLFVKQLFTHWNLGEKGDSKITCPEYNPNLDEKRPCPICAATKILREQMDSEDDKKKLSNWYSRGATYVNARMLMVGDSDVSNDKDYFLPKILRGPSKLSDHINYHLFQLLQYRQKKNFDFDGYLWDDEIVFDVKKIQTGKNKGNVKYEYQVSPIRAELLAEGVSMKNLVENMYDLDIILSNSVKWVREDYDTSVSLASSLLDFLGYTSPSPEQWEEIAPFQELEKKVGKNQEEKQEKQRKPLNIPGSQSKKKAVVQEDDSDNDTEEDPAAKTTSTKEAEEKVSPPVSVKKADVDPPKTLKVEKKSPEPIRDTSGEIVRDPDDIGDDGNPKCWGNQDNHAEECKSCRFLHMCLQERFKRKIDAKKAKG